MAGTIQDVVARNDKTHTFLRANEDCKMAMLQAPKISEETVTGSGFSFFSICHPLILFINIYDY